MNRNKEVWAIQHIGYEDLGSFETVFENRGFEVKYFCSRNVDYKGLFANDPELIVVLGGPMSVNDSDKYQWINRERQFVEDRLECEKPLLGICFGAQMIASALGAEVRKGKQGKEIGWSKITVNAEGKKTPFRHFDGEFTHMMHWHGDTFDLPDGAILLASSDMYNKQAYTYGDHVLAMQCHPEVTERKLKLWYSGSEDDVKEVGKTVKELMDHATRYNATLTNQAHKFLNEWLDEQEL